MNWPAVLLGILIWFAGYGCARFERAALIRHIPFLVEANRDQATMLRRIADALGITEQPEPDDTPTGPIALPPNPPLVQHSPAPVDEWKARFTFKEPSQ